MQSKVTSRPFRYVIVATLGAAVQAAVVFAAVSAGCPPVWATAAGIEAAILHNFAWHDRWTWGDRRSGRTAERLLRYNAAMATTSLAAGTTAAWLAVTRLGWTVAAANVAAVALAALANYAASDRAIFRNSTSRGGAGSAVVALACPRQVGRSSAGPARDPSS